MIKFKNYKLFNFRNKVPIIIFVVSSMNFNDYCQLFNQLQQIYY